MATKALQQKVTAVPSQGQWEPQTPFPEGSRRQEPYYWVSPTGRSEPSGPWGAGIRASVPRT